jgi:hypothetical protein
MDTVTRTDDIELGCDLTFERRWWRVQRIVWVILTLLILGGVVGIFGHGPLSEAMANPSGSGMQIYYDRLARRETPTQLQLRLEKAVIASGEVHIRLNRALLDCIQLKQIIPEPLATQPLADGARFIFRTDPTHDSALIVFLSSPTKPGFVESEVTVEGGEPVRFHQFVYP